MRSVSVEEVNYINGHATSTMIGDLAEIKALKKVFKKTVGIKMNATKSMIGHGMGAAGGLEAIATIKAIQTAISNSFGVGGHNSVVAVSAFKFKP
ncbi:Beta-ketoacyl synthase, C-terminal [Cynara cardunculus var. scolymus]|uniref:beta-ketoacyl-[acyl-carrier-protein] synthase I n=1 Tax=Cynara cardunculus var. scolymus TaxID=59895 RepID=A0A103Y1Q4_CYNCS|nr:Beta-ketoacyl synthase, C-terminal [Cynara cardunculus var. scolymus]